jgi:hypothetical protein
MNFLTAYNRELQVLAAFLIFVAGFLALFLAIMICLVAGLFIQAAAKTIRTQVVGLSPATSPVSSSVEAPAYPETSFSIPVSVGHHPA